MFESIINSNTKSQQGSCEIIDKVRGTQQGEFRRVYFQKVPPNSTSIRQEKQRQSDKQLREKAKGNREEYRAFDGSGWELINPVCRGYDGLSKELYEASLEAYGNAIVPQVAYQIFKSIEDYTASFEK